MNRFLTTEELVQRRRKRVRQQMLHKALGYLLATLTGLVAGIIAMAFFVFVVSAAIGAARWAF